jgi:flagellar basal body-associated protein FliL
MMRLRDVPRYQYRPKIAVMRRMVLGEQLMGRTTLKIVLVAGVCVFVCATLGCQSKSSFKFDLMDQLPPEEALKEFPLGDYKIPISVVVEDHTQNRITRRNRLQLDFKLYALITPKEKSRIEEAWSHHEGQIRDDVMSVCRSASLEELQEPELATLKGRLTDVLTAKLGEKPLRALVINQIVTQQL